MRDLVFRNTFEEALEVEFRNDDRRHLIDALAHTHGIGIGGVLTPQYNKNRICECMRFT
jgi:hypothetical protein